RLLVERGEDVPAVDLGLARRLRLERGPLEHALEGRRLLPQLVITRRQRAQTLGEKRFEAALERLEVAAALPDDVARRPLVEEGEEQMFERQELVAALDRLVRRQIQGRLQLSGDH